MHKAVSIIAVVGLALALMYVVDTYMFKNEFNLTETLIRMTVVLVAVGLAGIVFSKVTHKEASPKITV